MYDFRQWEIIGGVCLTAIEHRDRAAHAFSCNRERILATGRQVYGKPIIVVVTEIASLRHLFADIDRAKRHWVVNASGRNRFVDDSGHARDRHARTCLTSDIHIVCLGGIDDIELRVKILAFHKSGIHPVVGCYVKTTSRSGTNVFAELPK